MHIADPQYLHLLWLMPLLVLFYWWSFRQKRKALLRFADSSLVAQLVRGVGQTKQKVKVVVFLLFFLFVLLALLRPQWGTKLETVRRTGVDVVIALDTSLSMETQDVVPGRLEKAKHEIRALIDVLQGDRVGLVVFAGTSLVNCPLTIDQNAVKLFLDVVDTQVIPRPGTNIGEAIRRGIQTFDSRDRRHKVMILVTDGESVEGDPQAAAEEARQAGVVIYSIGVGTAAGEPIPLRDEKGNINGYKKDEDGSVVVSRLDEASLRQISSTTGGQYYRATAGEEEVEKIYQAVSGMDKKEFESKVYLTYVDRFQIPLGIALFFIFAESLISDVKPVRKRDSWLASLLNRRVSERANEKP
ncbi:MAG: VWA domain-containing protein [Acidobacteria bacterium]|nr:VWA domain-containing protein [Acidobacteriota bacterium]